MIERISHLTFVVADLDKATAFFESIFDAKEVYASGRDQFSISEEKFFLIGDLWIAIMKGDSLTEKTYNHIAFKVDDNDFDEYVSRIHSLGLTIKSGRPRIKGEGRSIYFYDDDNHLFEIHTGTLEERLARYNR